MPDMQQQPFDENLVRVYRTAPVDLASLDSEAMKGRVKVAVPQFDPQGELVRLKEEQVGNATVILSADDADREMPYIWISAAPERVAVPAGAVEQYGDYRVPAATVKKILGQDEELSYPEFVECSALQTYAELQGYVETLKTALENAKEDDRWIVVASPDMEVADPEAVRRALHDAPENAGMLHLAGFNKIGGFGEMPIRVGEGNTQIEGLVEPTRFYGGGQATAFRIDALPAVIRALEANMANEPQTTETENGVAVRGGVSPLDHVFALLQRSAALKVQPDEKHPEDKMVEAFREEIGEGDMRIYAMNPPTVVREGKEIPSPVKPVSRGTADAVRKIVHGQQMAGNAALVNALDPLVLCGAGQGARWLPEESLRDAASDISQMAEQKAALETVTELVEKRFASTSAEEDKLFSPRGLVDAIRVVGRVANQEEKLDRMKEAISNGELSARQLTNNLYAISIQGEIDTGPRRAAGGGARGR